MRPLEQRLPLIWRRLSRANLTGALRQYHRRLSRLCTSMRVTECTSSNVKSGCRSCVSILMPAVVVIVVTLRPFLPVTACQWVVIRLLSLWLTVSCPYINAGRASAWNGRCLVQRLAEQQFSHHCKQY